MSKAKLLGLVIDRREVGDVGAFDGFTDEQRSSHALSALPVRDWSRTTRSRVRPGQQGDEAYHATQYGWPPAFGVSHNTTRTNAPVTRYGAARFLSERRGRLTRFAVDYLVGRTAEAAGFPDLHPHCLRHSCGYALADRGVDLRTIQEWLGHRSIEMTVRYERTTG